MATMTPAEARQSLEGENYINLETFKRNGNGVKTPIWFAHEGGELVFFTDSRSWKVKRLRRNDRVRIVACGMRGAIQGEWFEGSCHRLEGDEAKVAHKALTKKYWLLMRVGNAAAGLTGRTKHRAYYRIVVDSGPDA